MEKGTKGKVELSFKLLDLTLDEFEVEKELPSKFLDIGLNKEQVAFEFRFNIEVAPLQDLLIVELKICFFAEKEKKTQLGQQKSTGKFEIKNLASALDTLKGKLPNQFVASLIGLVLSTSRGFFILKSKQTILQGIMIPALNPLAFFPEKQEEKS
ncbi:MAG: hypothetical protein PF484_03715 [Bacteroidales bacterium]|jgi:hypothetical protein|nr:hypothetical protein [Bacteroidales bacterium]